MFIYIWYVLIFYRSKLNNRFCSDLTLSLIKKSMILIISVLNFFTAYFFCLLIIFVSVILYFNLMLSIYFPRGAKSKILFSITETNFVNYLYISFCLKIFKIFLLLLLFVIFFSKISNIFFLIKLTLCFEAYLFDKFIIFNGSSS